MEPTEKKPKSTKEIVLATVAVCLILFAIVLVALVATGVIKGDPKEEEQVEEVPIVAEGEKCGDNLTYTLTDGVLTISGSGDMYDYDDNEAEDD